MKKYLFIFSLLGASVGSALSQNFVHCATHSMTQAEFDKNPDAVRMNAELESFTQQYIESRKGMKGTTDTFITIPVVVHILHQWGPENIDDEQVYSAIETINKDYAKENSDTSQVIDTFQSIIGKAMFRFRLARLDPNGNPTTGITRHYSVYTQDGRANEEITSSFHWDTRKYLNVYVVKTITDAGAYSYLPASFPAGSYRPGVVARYTQFGNYGPSQGNLAARTFTHEVGHFMNLSHTWGNTNTPGVASNCDADDFVDDTPNTIGYNGGGCNKNMSSCVSGKIANVENYMDYASCERMFTIGQVARMRAAAQVPQRNTLHTSSNLVATGTNDGYVPMASKPIAEFNSSSRSVCAGSSVLISDESWNGEVTSRTWVIEGATLNDASAEVVSATFTNPGTYTVKLIVENAAGKDSMVKADYINVVPANGLTNYVMTFESNDNLVSQLYYDSQDNKQWEVSNTVSYSGLNSVFLNLFNGSLENGEEYNLVLPAVDFTGVTTGQIKFKYAYTTRTSASADVFKVQVSGNCGKSWVNRFTGTGAEMETASRRNSNFKPASVNEWKEKVIDISTIKGLKDGLVRFSITKNGGNNFYIDDVEISTDIASGIQFIDNSSITMFPNPSNGNTTLNFEVLENNKVSIALYDLMGREVMNIANQELMSKGSQSIAINTKALGAGGVYLVRVQAGNQILIKKLMLN
jgi:PKD repeat protein